MKFYTKNFLIYIQSFMSLAPNCPYCGKKMQIFHSNSNSRFKPNYCPVCKKEFEDYLSLKRFLITIIIMIIGILVAKSDTGKLSIVFFTWVYLFYTHNLRKIDIPGTIGEQLVTIKTIKNDVFDCFNTWDTYYIYFVDIEGVPLTSGYPIKLEYVNDWFTNVKSRISFIEIEPEQKFLQVGSKFCLFYNKQQIGKGSIIFYQKI